MPRLQTHSIKDDEDDDHMNTLCPGSKHIAVHWGSKMMVRMRISRHFGQ